MRRSVSIGILSFLAMAGCVDGDSEGGTGTDTDGGPGAGGGPSSGGAGSGGRSDAGGGAGGAGEADVCGVPGARVVATARRYSDGSVIPRLVLDGSTLFFGTLDEIHSVPTAGGEPTRVYPPAPAVAVYPPFWIRGADLVVGRGDALEILPKEGGAVTATKDLPATYASNLSGRAGILLDADGRTFFAKSESGILVDPPEVEYFSYDIEGEASEVLLTGTGLGHGSQMVRAGGHLYTKESGGGAPDAEDPTPDTLHRIPVAGGAAETVAITGNHRFELLGADDTHLFFGGRPAPFDLTADPGGIYRVSIDGGAPEQIVRRYIPTVDVVTGFVSQPERVLIRYLDQIYSAPHGSGEATEVVSARCEVHAFTASGDDLYFSTFDDGDETSTLVHVAVPR